MGMSTAGLPREAGPLFFFDFDNRDWTNGSGLTHLGRQFGRRVFIEQNHHALIVLREDFGTFENACAAGDTIIYVQLDLHGFLFAIGWLLGCNGLVCSRKFTPEGHHRFGCVPSKYGHQAAPNTERMEERCLAELLDRLLGACGNDAG